MPPETATDQAGVTRTPDGTIADQSQSQQTSSSTASPTSTPAATTDTTQSKTDQTKTEPTSTKTEPKADDKSLASKADTKKEDTKAPQGAPEKYEPYTLPEGLELDATVVEEANKLFKELGLPQAAAQRIVDQHVALMQKAAQEPVDFFNQQKMEWRKELIADKTLGDGKENLNAKTLKQISDVKNALGPELKEAFQEAMDYTGAGDHPAFIKAMVKIAEFISEGSHVSGKGPSPLGQTPTGSAARPTPAQAMYPNLPSAASGR